jgi:hypothetical protein
MPTLGRRQYRNILPMDQPVPKISLVDIERIINRDYSQYSTDIIIELLKNYKTDEGNYRIWAAILKNGNGNIDLLKQNIDLAITDFRDVISTAEYPEYSNKVGFDDDKLSKKQLRNIINKDWDQYRNWLNRK